MIGPIGGASAFFAEPQRVPAAAGLRLVGGVECRLRHQRPEANKVALLWENDELGRSAKRGFDLYMEANKKRRPNRSRSR